MTSVPLKLQVLIIIAAYLQHVTFSYDLYHKLPYDTVKIVTYGEPCNVPCNLPVKIEVPILPTEKSNPQKLYKPLKLNYKIVSKLVDCKASEKYPISIEVPEVPPMPIEKSVPDLLRGKSYGYNVQAPLPSSVPISRNYDFDLQIPFSPSSRIVTDKPVKLLTGLTSRIDKVLVPACEVPSSNCRN